MKTKYYKRQTKQLYLSIEENNQIFKYENKTWFGYSNKNKRWTMWLIPPSGLTWITKKEAFIEMI